jgi:hypothetical protein
MKSFKIAVTAILVLVNTTMLHAQVGANGNGNGYGQTWSNYNFGFNNVPVLISGTDLQVGAMYRVADVANATSAVITIVSATGGAKVAMLDDNNLTKPEAFSPRISLPPNSNGMVEFRVQFFVGNTNMNTTRLVDTLRATAMDIDGTMGAYHEMDALNMGAGASVRFDASTLEIAMSQNGNEYLATNVGGVEYPAVDTSAKNVMFTLMNTSLTQFTYKAGVNNLSADTVTRQKGIYFKGFNYERNPLPVKFESFTATAQETTNLLTWVTSQEINNNYFEVEQSTNGTEFKSIAKVNAGAHGNTKQTYSYADNNANSAEVVYYRIKQVDMNGKFSTTNTLIVKRKLNADVKLEVSPNPFVASVTARFNSTEIGNASLMIKGFNSQTVLNKTVKINKGSNNVQIDGLSNLANGTYIAVLVMNGKIIANQKIVK